MDDQAFDLLLARLERIENKVDLLFAFKWQIIGGSVVMSFIIATVISIIAAYISKG